MNWDGLSVRRYTVYYSEHEKQGRNGVVFRVRKGIARTVFG